MWDKITDIAKTAAAMLSSNKVPPGAPPEQEEELKRISFLKSRKFFIVFSSVFIIAGYFLTGVFILFMTAAFPAIIEPYVTIFVEILKVFTIIIASYLGLQTMLDFRYNSETKTELNKTTVIEDKPLNGPKEEDYTIKMP